MSYTYTKTYYADLTYDHCQKCALGKAVYATLGYPAYCWETAFNIAELHVRFLPYDSARSETPSL